MKIQNHFSVQNSAFSLELEAAKVVIKSKE
jgi:hypothetical protein